MEQEITEIEALANMEEAGHAQIPTLLSLMMRSHGTLKQLFKADLLKTSKSHQPFPLGKATFRREKRCCNHPPHFNSHTYPLEMPYSKKSHNNTSHINLSEEISTIPLPPPILPSLEAHTSKPNPTPSSKSLNFHISTRCLKSNCTTHSHTKANLGFHGSTDSLADSHGKACLGSHSSTDSLADSHDKACLGSHSSTDSFLGHVHRKNLILPKKCYCVGHKRFKSRAIKHLLQRHQRKPKIKLTNKFKRKSLDPNFNDSPTMYSQLSCLCCFKK